MNGTFWHLDPDTRLNLRLDVLRRAAAGRDWRSAVLEAEELLDEAPGHLEALGLLANALLETGDAVNARTTFEAWIASAGPAPDMLSGLAIAALESGDGPAAIEAAEKAIRLGPELAEAHFTLGLALDQVDHDRAELAFREAERLDPVAYPRPMELTVEGLADAVVRALRDASLEVARMWTRVPIEIVEVPLPEDLAGPTPIPPTVAGFYVGRPCRPGEERDPEALRLFRRNLARCGDPEILHERLVDLLEQEAADWWGR